mgnify:CR=1 FL=1
MVCCIEKRVQGGQFSFFCPTEDDIRGVERSGGLGLHIVHNLVFNTLGGSVSVKSQVGEGTEFQLELPLIAPAQVKPQ